MTAPRLVRTIAGLWQQCIRNAHRLSERTDGLLGMPAGATRDASASAMRQLIGPNTDNIIRARGPVTGVALVGLIWSASTIFYTLNQILNKIWGNKRSRPLWRLLERFSLPAKRTATRDGRPNTAVEFR